MSTATQARPERRGPAMAPPITLEILKELFPRGLQLPSFVQPLRDGLPLAKLATREQVAMFLAQTGHESDGYSRLVEGLNYSWERLLVVFPKYFPDIKTAKLYHRQPEKIANRVYADRIGNGPEESGDGWRYRGRGLIQLSGRMNYARFASVVGKPLYEVTAWLDTPIGAVASALWYWTENHLRDYGGDVKRVTKIVNGGENGLKDRMERFDLAMSVLAKHGG